MELNVPRHSMYGIHDIVCFRVVQQNRSLVCNSSAKTAHLFATLQPGASILIGKSNRPVQIFVACFQVSFECLGWLWHWPD